MTVYVVMAIEAGREQWDVYTIASSRSLAERIIKEDKEKNEIKEGRVREYLLESENENFF